MGATSLAKVTGVGAFADCWACTGAAATVITTASHDGRMNRITAPSQENRWPILPPKTTGGGSKRTRPTSRGRRVQKDPPYEQRGPPYGAGVVTSPCRASDAISRRPEAF